MITSNILLKNIYFFTVQCTLYNVHCTMYTVQCTLYNVHCTMYTVQCTLYNVHCTMYTVQCTLYNVHCTMYNRLMVDIGSRIICGLLWMVNGRQCMVRGGWLMTDGG